MNRRRFTTSRADIKLTVNGIWMQDDNYGYVIINGEKISANSATTKTRYIASGNVITLCAKPYSSPNSRCRIEVNGVSIDDASAGWSYFPYGLFLLEGENETIIRLSWEQEVTWDPSTMTGTVTATYGLAILITTMNAWRYIKLNPALLTASNSPSSKQFKVEMPNATAGPFNHTSPHGISFYGKSSCINQLVDSNTTSVSTISGHKYYP